MCHSSGGYGTWTIDSEKDYEYWITRINETMPYAETILTEMVANVEKNVVTHVYVRFNRLLQMTFFSAFSAVSMRIDSA